MAREGDVTCGGCGGRPARGAAGEALDRAALAGGTNEESLTNALRVMLARTNPTVGVDILACIEHTLDLLLSCQRGVRAVEAQVGHGVLLAAEGHVALWTGLISLPSSK